jgi:hypothetical protein
MSILSRPLSDTDLSSLCDASFKKAIDNDKNSHIGDDYFNVKVAFYYFLLDMLNTNVNNYEYAISYFIDKFNSVHLTIKLEILPNDGSLKLFKISFLDKINNTDDIFVLLLDDNKIKHFGKLNYVKNNQFYISGLDNFNTFRKETVRFNYKFNNNEINGIIAYCFFLAFMVLFFLFCLNCYGQLFVQFLFFLYMYYLMNK